MRGQWIRLWVAFFVGLGLGVGAEASSREQILGQVRLSGGLPVAGAQVMLFDLADLRRGVVAQTTTNALGSFALPLGRRPNGVVLGQNYPNPFNPSTVIPYELSSSSWVRLEVFNLLGQRLALLVDGEQEAGAHRARWDGTDGSGRAAAAGVYLYRLTVGESSQTGRMVLVDGQAGVPLGGSGVEVVSSLGSDGSYGLVVLGDGIVAYVDADFEMASGLVAIEVESARGARGKASQEGILGDVNNNGRVDADDALLVMAYSLKGSVSLPDGGDISLGDVDRDGRITVTDAWLIATYVIDPADPVLPLGIGTPISLEVDSLEVDSLEVDGYDRGNDNTYITIWEVISGRKVHQIDAGNVYALAFSPDGKYLAAGDDEGIITFYQIPINITLTTRVTKERTIQAIRAVEDLAWSPYGRFISDGKKVYRVLLDLSSRD